MGEPILHLIFDNKIFETIKISKDITTIGRMQDNDVVINNLGVSRRHCQIVRDENGDFYVEDLGSANGIRVNGVQVQRSPLKEDDEITVGKHKLVFQIADKGVAGFFKSEEKKESPLWMGDKTIYVGSPAPSAGQTETPPLQETQDSSIKESESSPPKVQASASPVEFDRQLFEYVLKWCDYGVKVVFDGKIVSVHGLKKTPVTIGRAKDSNIVIDNLGVSRTHARIFFEDGHYIVEDLGSANGIKVNGVQMRRSIIYPGDEILIGKHVLVFDLAERLLGEVKSAPIVPRLESQDWIDETYTLEKGEIDKAVASPPVTAEADISQPVELRPWEGKYSIKVMLGEREVASYALTKKVICIGRLKENDIVIDNLGVSRLHAKIIIEDNGQVRIEDQDSANGIIVNGIKLRRSPLYPGDEITIVKHKLLFDLTHRIKPDKEAGGREISNDPWSLDSTRALSTEDLEKLRKTPTLVAPDKFAESIAQKEKGEKTSSAADLTLAAGGLKEVKSIPEEQEKKIQPMKGKEKQAPPHKTEAQEPSAKHYVGWLVKRDGTRIILGKEKTLIGKGENADIKIEGTWIKRRHAEIVREGRAGYRLVSYGLFKKPLVNGRRISESALRNGDVITIGGVSMTFQLKPLD